MKRWIILMAGICLLLSGCTKSNIVYGNNNKHDDQYQPVNGIVWEQLWEDFSEIYADPDIYPFAASVNAGVYPEENVVKFNLLVNEEISGKEASDYATKAVKGFNDLIAAQNSAYAPSDVESYGGYLAQYGIYVMVGPDATKDDPDTWIIEDLIPQGEYRPVGGNAWSVE